MNRSSAVGSRRPHRLLLAGGLWGLTAAAVALICCATPTLALILGALGLGAATAAVGTAIDTVALPLAAVSLLLVGSGLYRKRRSHSALDD